jgi:hypothetical protein
MRMPFEVLAIILVHTIHACSSITFKFQCCLVILIGSAILCAGWARAVLRQRVVHAPHNLIYLGWPAYSLQPTAHSPQPTAHSPQPR